MRKAQSGRKKALQTIEIHYTDIGCISKDTPQGKRKSPAGNLSVIPAGELPQIVDTHMRGSPTLCEASFRL